MTSNYCRHLLSWCHTANGSKEEETLGQKAIAKKFWSPSSLWWHHASPPWRLLTNHLVKHCPQPWQCSGCMTGRITWLYEHKSLIDQLSTAADYLLLWLNMCSCEEGPMMWLQRLNPSREGEGSSHTATMTHDKASHWELLWRCGIVLTFSRSPMNQWLFQKRKLWNCSMNEEPPPLLYHQPQELDRVPPGVAFHCFKGHHTLRTPWSWQNIVSTTAPERAVLSVLSLGVALWTGQSGASEVAERCISLASIWLAFAGHVLLFWLWLPLAREMDSASRQWNTEKDMRNVRDFVVKRLPSGGTRCWMPQQTRYAGVCADWEQKLCVFWSRPNPHRRGQRHRQWASSLVWRLWLARFVSDVKSTPPPGDVTAQTD